MKILKSKFHKQPGANPILELKKHPQPKTKFSVSTQEGVFIYAFTDILYCTSKSNYTEIHSKDGSKLLVSRTLKSFAETFPRYSFCRSHQSFLINVNEVATIKQDHLILSDQTRIPISKSKHKSCIAHILNRTSNI